MVTKVKGTVVAMDAAIVGAIVAVVIGGIAVVGATAGVAMDATVVLGIMAVVIGPMPGTAVGTAGISVVAAIGAVFVIAIVVVAANLAITAEGFITSQQLQEHFA